MISVIDNYLPKEVFSLLQQLCEVDSNFDMVERGEKSFCAMETPRSILPYFNIEGKELILSFVRKAYKGFDNELRIHADNIIEGHKSTLASVLYINKPEGVSRNGTATWCHHKYGINLPGNISNEEFDRLIIEDSNDISKWKQRDYINAEPNRLLTYDANFFHSKIPKEIEEGERIVMVFFYR